jgi:hypothetical protein
MKRLAQNLVTGLAVVCAFGFIYMAVFAGTNSASSVALGDPYPPLDSYPVFLPFAAKPYVPLLVGLHLRWDSNGYVRGSEYYDIGYHLERELTGMTDSDTIRCENYDWYDPNPFGWPPETWQSYYSVSTGYFKSSSVPSDPSWKWGCPWILPYEWRYHNGQTVSLGGQVFIVSGPHSGYTAWGQAVQYWQLVNRDSFLFWDGGGDWKQYVSPGDITLRYDAGESRLMLYRNVLRTYYFQGAPTIDTVQYIDLLTYASSFPGTVKIATEADLVSSRESNLTWAKALSPPEKGLRALHGDTP